MSRYRVPAIGIYVHDASQSLRAQVCGSLGGNSAQELLQVWDTTRSIGPKLYLLPLRAAGPVPNNGRQVIRILRAAGVKPLWPHQDGRFEQTQPWLAAWQTLFGGNLRYL